MRCGVRLTPGGISREATVYCFAMETGDVLIGKTCSAVQRPETLHANSKESHRLGSEVFNRIANSR